MTRFLRDHPLLGFLGLHAGLGAAIAGGVVALLLLADVGGLGTLVFASEDPMIPIVMLGFGFVITLSSAAAGTAVMSLGLGTGGGGRRRPGAAPIPAPVAVRASSTGRRRAL